MNIIITRGGSGAGKSTWTKTNHPNARVFSADQFFMVNGNYKFDPTKLGEAHAACLRSFIDYCQQERLDGAFSAGRPAPTEVAIVDNTNTSVSEFAPYAQVGQVYGHSIQILTWVYDQVMAHARNGHGTPLKACIDQHRRLIEQTAFIPPWWKHDYVVALGLNGLT
jgi:predicted kinase